MKGEYSLSATEGVSPSRLQSDEEWACGPRDIDLVLPMFVVAFFMYSVGSGTECAGFFNCVAAVHCISVGSRV